MRSVRRRLTVALVAGFAALALVGGLVTSRAVAERLTGDFDASLEAQARALLALTEDEAGRIELDYVPSAMPQYERAERPDLFQFWLDDGTALVRSARLRGDLPRPERQAAEARFSDARLPDGRAGRVVGLAWTPKRASPPDPGDEDEPAQPTVTGPRHGVLLAVARDRDGIDATIGGVRTAVLGIAGLAALLAVVLVWRTLAFGLRPIDDLARQVRGLGAHRLQARVALDGVPRELVPIVEQLNALLDRLSSSFDRERLFAGNVAHELRTPIAELRSLSTVASRWPDDAAAVSGYFGDVASIAGRMDSLVGDLLLLARCHAGVERAVLRSVPLREAVVGVAQPLSDRAAERGLHVRIDVPEDLSVESDPTRLDVVLSNLLRNAVAHSREGTQVRCTAERTETEFHLEVRNAAEPLSAEDLARLTDPFWRKDAARSPDGHAGIGLSLVGALASLLRLTVRFAQEPNGTFVARVTGPATPPGAAATESPPPVEAREGVP